MIEVMSNNCVVYVRKSTEAREDRQILSLNDQLLECRDIIRKQNLNLAAAPFQESKSAKKAQVRTEFYNMLETLKAKKASIIVCWAANRLARNSIDGGAILDLIQNHAVKIVTPYTTYDQNNWFMLMIEFGMATDYSLKLSKDVKRGMDSKVKMGWRPGLAPLGYRNCREKEKGRKDIAPDADRWILCRKWWEMMLTGKYSVEESRRAVTALGLRDNRGDEISKNAAYKFFRNIFYSGYFTYLGEMHKGSHKAMVSVQEFKKMQHILDGRKVETTELKLPLAGFIKCGECGATITCERKVKKYKNGTSTLYEFYRCTKKLGPCSQPYVRAEELNGQAQDFIASLSLDEKFTKWVRGVLKRRNREEFDAEKKHREQITKQLNELDRRKENLFDMKIDGLYSPEDYKLQVNRIVLEEADLKSSLSSKRIDYWEKVIDQTLTFANKVKEYFNSGDSYTKKMVLKILGSDLILRDKKLQIEAKSAFIFLADAQKELRAKKVRLELKNRLSEQPEGTLFETKYLLERVRGVGPLTFTLEK
jgi:site-specific DNA recombinase